MTNDRDNQDQYDVIQAQTEWDEKTAVNKPTVNDSTVDTNRSELSEHISSLFNEKYSINPLQPAGQLVKTWTMLHDEIQVIVKELEDKVAGHQEATEQERLNEPEEKHWTS